MHAMFETDLASSTPITLEQWDRRSLSDRAERSDRPSLEYWLWAPSIRAHQPAMTAGRCGNGTPDRCSFRSWLMAARGGHGYLAPIASISRLGRSLLSGDR